MEQDDKVSAAALSSGSASMSSRTIRVGEAEVGHDGVLGTVVGSASTMSTEAPHGAGEVTGSELPDASSDDTKGPADKPGAKTAKTAHNNVRKIRIERMMSKAELARRANLSVLTIDRVERGYGCRVDTKRKILEALGLSLADRVRVFGEEE